MEKQKGGSCIILMEKYGQYPKTMDKYEKGLGRWSWLRIEGNNEINTKVIVAYSPCKPRKSSLLYTYAQQKRYWNIRGFHGCAKEKLEKTYYLLINYAKKVIKS